MSEMNWSVLFGLLLMNIAAYSARSQPKIDLREHLEARRVRSDEIGRPRRPWDRVGLAFPGHALLQPSDDSLTSAVQFPQKDNKTLVYGNLDNLSITYGKTRERVLYTGFRKDNDILDMLLTPSLNKYFRKPLLVYIRRKPHNPKDTESEYGRQVSEEENIASEILDNKAKVIKAIFRCSEELFGEANDIQDYRRRNDALAKFRDRDDSSDTTDSGAKSSSSSSSDYERNPGNPYTVYKDKYIQNWMWNHNLDGEHMNINPYAPQFNSLGPSGASLFFNRKWWYYNQDDFRPFS